MSTTHNTLGGAHSAPAHGGHDHAHHESPTPLGFWIYLMSDCLIFATLFATYAVLGFNYAGGPGPEQIFEPGYVGIETALLLLSSVAFGVGMLHAVKSDMGKTTMWLVIAGLFAVGFVGMEINEFHHLIKEGFGPDRSGFLSAFFLLVGTHGLHVTMGCVWLIVLLVQLAKRGFTEANMRRLNALSVFWHFLDLIWIGVFSFVYLVRLV